MKDGLKSRDGNAFLNVPNGMTPLPASFRDPSGFIFERDGVLYRQINKIYGDHYDLLMRSGLCDRLTEEGMLVRHREVDGSKEATSEAYKFIRPERVRFISYPYEWCFTQLKEAAILTLDIQLTALAYDMTLKDASAYNIHFDKGRPVMIDTLSFEKYEEGRPWVAYRQFCQHFLATLALMSKKDIRLNNLLPAYIDGIPLDLASTLLPRSTWFNPGLLIHLHLHAKSQKKYGHTDSINAGKKKDVRPVSKPALLTILKGLRKTVAKLECPIKDTEWANYYDATNYSDTASEKKGELVRRFLENTRPETVWDLGGNTGVYSRIATDMGIPTVCFDIDPMAVDFNYQQVRLNNETLMLPLLLDLTNPSPGIGWGGTERDSFVQRAPADCGMALALIHHLAISNNLPFDKIASFLAKICRNLIIEFIPKEDSQVQRLLTSREDIFTQYDEGCFKSVFSQYFDISDRVPIDHSHRTLYLMRKKQG
jgi:hypothetical protein